VWFFLNTLKTTGSDGTITSTITPRTILVVEALIVAVEGDLRDKSRRKEGDMDIGEEALPKLRAWHAEQVSKMTITTKSVSSAASNALCNVCKGQCFCVSAASHSNKDGNGKTVRFAGSGETQPEEKRDAVGSSSAPRSQMARPLSRDEEHSDFIRQLLECSLIFE